MTRFVENSARGRRAAGFAFAIALSAGAAGAATAETLRCEAPPIPACQSCLTTLALTVRRDGSCEVGVAQGWAAPESAIAQRPIMIEITIEGPPPSPFAHDPGPAPAVGLPLRTRPSGRCFVFQHQRFCE